MTRYFTICVLHVKSVVKNLNTNYMILLQKFRDETPYELCSSSKFGSVIKSRLLKWPGPLLKKKFSNGRN
jgi:hypothetical protein